MNRSSMSVFSGPYRAIGPTWSGIFRSAAQVVGGDADGAKRLRYLPDRHFERCGWLLTGDTTLRDKEVLDRFARFFSVGPVDYLARTLLFTTPHHGSDGNFGTESLRRLGAPPVAVVPAGRGEYFGHPSKPLLQMIREHGVEVVHVGRSKWQGLRHHYFAFDINRAR